MINIKEIKEKCPKAYELLRQYIGNSLVEMQKRMSNNVGSVKIEEIPPVDDRIIEGILVWNQRSLYSFFDKNKVLLLLDGPDEMHGWSWQIRAKDVVNDTKAHSDVREVCEDEGFTECFNQLEKQL